MNLLIAGGGTGGHLFPGLALAQELRAREPAARILFVGTERGIETRAVPKAGFELELINISGLRRVGMLGFVRGMVRLPLALLAAIRLVRRFRPDVAVSVGGYAAGPAVLASRLCGVSCAVMEQNAIPGFTNRVLSRFSQRVFAGLPIADGVDPNKVDVVGNPVRPELLAVRDRPYQPSSPLRLLVFGGSQGARALNEVMMAVLPRLAELAAPVRVVHQTGQADYERVVAALAGVELPGGTTYEVKTFIDDMAAAYADADLVLCRSGATTIAELTVCGRPAILVPFPFAVDDHQTKNARTLHDVDAGIHIPQQQLSAAGLLELFGELATEPEKLARMAKNSRDQGHPAAATEILAGLRRLVADKTLEAA